MTLVARAHPHRRAIFVFFLLLIGGGVWSAYRTGRGIYPDVAFQRVTVIAEQGETPVRAMLLEVTRPIEVAVSAVPALQRVRSKTVRGGSEISLDFTAEADMRDALALVRSRVAEAGLPKLERLTIERQTPALFPVISFNVLPGEADASDPVKRARLAEWTELFLKPRLARLPDAFFVTVQSGDAREYVFEVDPLALASYGISIDAVRDALKESNAVTAVGRVSREGLQYQVLVDGQFDDTDAIGKVAIERDGKPPVELSALGRVVESTADRTTIVTGGGQDGVVVSVFLRDGGKVTDLSRDVTNVVEEVSPSIPHHGRIDRVYDQAMLVEASLVGVRDAIGLGGLLAIVVLFLFLGNWRVTLVAGLAIPISVLLTLAIFPAMKESLNLMSLGGLAVAIGLIIDDAIVVVENVARRLAHLDRENSGFPAIFSAVAVGTQEVVGAIVGSSLTTVVVFVPLALLEGVVGQFFQSLAFALGISILVSMVVSLLLVPLLMLIPALRPRAEGSSRAFMNWMQSRYAALATSMLRHRALTTFLALDVLAVLALFARGVPTGFLPEMDEGGFVLDYTLPVGSSLEETDATCRKIEAILIATPEVGSFSRRTGAELGFFATEQFTGDMLVGLKKGSKRSIFEVIAELRERIPREVPQAEVEFIQVMQDTINDLAGNPSPIEVKLLGAEYPLLQSTAKTIADRIEKIPGIVDVTSSVSFGSPEIAWKIDPVAAARYKLSPQSISDQLEVQSLGDVATRIKEGERFLDVRVRYPEPWRVHEVDDVPFVGPVSGAEPPGLVPLTEVATRTRRLSENELERENQVPMVVVTAAIEGRDLGSASDAVAAAIADLKVDPRVRVEYGGQAASQAEAFKNLVFVFGLAAGLTFLLLVVQFRSLRLPLVMFLALPFGQLGGLLALRFTGIALNVSSAMGLIMLVGLVVKNGIILIEYAEQLCAEGLEETAAIIEAARVRLRPILMTTLAAIAGLVPLAFGIGAGAELQRPLAVAVIGGLLLSTASTLVVVPLGCATLGRGRLKPESLA